MEVSIRANQQIVEELRGEEIMCQALLEIMGPEINKIVDEVTKRAKEETEDETRKEDIESVVRC